MTMGTSFASKDRRKFGGFKLFSVFFFAWSAFFGPAFVLANRISGDQLSVYFTTDLPRRLEFSNDTGAFLHCTADGNPRPDVQWSTSERGPLTELPGLRRDFRNGTLHFPTFRAEDYREDVHAASYVCVATNYRGALISNEVHVRAVVKQHYEVQVYDEFVLQGNVGILRCHIPSFVEEYIRVVAWMTDDGAVVSVHENADRFMVTSQGDLYIANVMPSDNDSVFRCKTVNRLTGESKTSNPGRITITDTQSSIPPRITHAKASVACQQGDSVELICASQGFPVPTCRWYRVSAANQELTPIPTEGRLRQWKSLLILTQAQVSDSGLYKCVVVNSVGEESTETLLRVTAPLTVQVSPRIQTVDVSKSAALTCIANGYPPMTSLLWYKNGRPLETDQRVSFTSSKMLTIAEAGRDDQGIYQCFLRGDELSTYGVAELRLGRK